MGLVHETKLAILCALAEEPDNGYQIAKKTGISKGSVYDHLHDLEQEGMVVLLDEQESGRGKKTYRITENGMKLLEALDEL